jgi:hypothetical protein
VVNGAYIVGDLVIVQEDGKKEKRGKVIEACMPEDLPHLGPGSPSFLAHQLMVLEWQVDFVVYVLYDDPGDDGESWFTCALHSAAGWHSSQLKPLRLRRADAELKVVRPEIPLRGSRRRPRSRPRSVA